MTSVGRHPLLTALPDPLDAALGYPGDARWLIVGAAHAGEPVWDDGRMRAPVRPAVWRGLRARMQVPYGLLLACDRAELQAFAVSEEQAGQLLASQAPGFGHPDPVTDQALRCRLAAGPDPDAQRALLIWTAVRTRPRPRRRRPAG